MNRYQITGLLQLAMVLLVLAGFIAKSDVYWFLVDLAIILLCSLSAVFLFTKKSVK
jgi:hypothetical protein